MLPNRAHEFRLYYNHSIQPELLRLERSRLRLVMFTVVAVLAFLGVLVVHGKLRILLVTLTLNIPLGAAIVYLLYHITQFIRQFKPRIVGLLLDFIDDGPNFDPLQPLRYDAQGDISGAVLSRASLFDLTDAALHSEDKLEGKVGEMAFTMAEINISTLSALRQQLQVIFRGVFIHARFNEPGEGHIIAWPRNHLAYHTRAIRAFTFAGAVPVDDEIQDPDFRQRFAVFATADTHVAGVFTEPMQEAIADYCRQYQRNLCIAVHQQDVYVAISRDKDMLEPSIFRSNLSFEQIQSYYADINALLAFVAMLDQTH